jgi:citronellol/citronellal dehydrogenase
MWGDQKTNTEQSSRFATPWTTARGRARGPDRGRTLLRIGARAKDVVLDIPGTANLSFSLAGKTLFITGASRGIGLAIGLAAASDGANVVIAAKTVEANPRLPGTIHSAAEDIEKAGGKALPLAVDVRDEAQVRAALDRTVETFGGVDIVVNNASAISLTHSQATDMKRFDLMHQINARGTFMTSKLAVPFLEKSANPHILTLSPPLDMKEKWFAGHTAYSMAKYGMSLVVLGLAGELRGRGIAVNALWPRTTIATAAIRNLLGGDSVMRASRTPAILADAARLLFLKDARAFTGHFLIDDTFLFDNGVRDFDRYRVDPTVDLAPDFFVPEDSVPPVSLKKIS